MISLATAELWLEESRESLARARYHGWAEWATAYLKRVRDLEKIVSRLRAAKPSDAETQRRVNMRRGNPRSPLPSADIADESVVGIAMKPPSGRLGMLGTPLGRNFRDVGPMGPLDGVEDDREDM